MFGMLDFRAHKLYWLLTFPFRLTNWVMLFAAIPVGIIVARSTPYAWWAKIMIAYLVFGLALIIGGLLLGGSLWLFSRTFFFNRRYSTFERQRRRKGARRCAVWRASSPLEEVGLENRGLDGKGYRETSKLYPVALPPLFSEQHHRALSRACSVSAAIL